VEIYYEGDPAFLSDFASLPQGRDYCISFRWGGATDECACASIASYILAKHFDAVVSDEGAAPVGLEELLLGAQQASDQVRKGGRSD
jgi:hypothetical protein